MSRLACLLLVALVLVPVDVSAEEESSAEPAEIMARLRSDVPKEAAWAAYLAGRERISGAVPLLLQVLRPDPARTANEWRLVDRAVLDALIRLDATVPADLLQARLGRRFARQAVILMARDVKRNRAHLMGLFDRWEDDGRNLWIGTVGIGNLLARARTPGLAGRVLPWIEMSLTLSVHDEGTIGVGGGAGGPFPGRGHRRFEVPEGFPPTVTYDFVPPGEGGQTVLADGAFPVHVLRREWTGTKVVTSERIHHVERGKCARAWIAALSRVKAEKLGLPGRGSRAGHYRGDAEFLAWARECHDDVIERYWRIVGELLEDGLLGFEEASRLEPKLTLTVVDCREVKSPALPPLPEMEVTRPEFLEELDASEIAARLRSDSAAEVAWGAYLAGRQGCRDVVPLLLESLRPSPKRTGDLATHTTHAILDALVRLDARVPADLLAGHLVGRSAVPTLILLSRDPARNRVVLLAYFDRWAVNRKHVELETLAAGNLLASLKAPGFAARILKWVSMRLLLYVREPGAFHGRGDRRDLRAGSGDTRISVPAGFPPFAEYRLESGPGSDGARLVAEGVRPIWYARRERAERHYISGRSLESVPGSRVCREWIATMLGCDAKSLGIPARDAYSHDWNSAQDYLRWATDRRDRLLSRYWKVVSRLIARGALTVEEARGLEPDLRVEVRDRRKAPEVPLPPLPPTKVRAPGDD
jgi:hypothetical protein